MKLSNYVFNFLKDYTDTVFLLSGGGIMHLVDSLGNSNLNAVCCHHEQACAIAAEGYARIKNKIGVALVTTGPGGTNAITGVAGAWLDSIPMLVISGQVKTEDITPRKNGVPIVRAIGFQELNVIDLVKPITKYAITVDDPKCIKYYLEKALYLATNERPGPVWIEIPLDIQATEIDVKKLRGFKKPLIKKNWSSDKIKLVVNKLNESKRPMVLVGSGVRLAGGEKLLLNLLDKLKINVATTIFTADDLVTYDYPYYLGRQGMPGNEAANEAIDNCDLLLIIGDRMQLTQTSYDHKNFAPNAYKIMVDIDKNELEKKKLKIDLPICMDAKLFLKFLLKEKIKINRWSIGIKSIDICKYDSNKGFLNVYKFLEELYKYIGKFNITTANGMASLATHQELKIKSGQRFITNAGLGHMGSGLPMSIGACFASNKSPTICMEGDGSIMLNIQELQTILYHKLPIKIFIFNNGGYFSIRNTHLNYFKKVFASCEKSGLSIPDFSKIIPAWGFDYERINNNKELYKLEKINNNKPIVFELMIDPDQKMVSKWSAGNFKKTYD
jgi:acetolactate synthase I/II/III large subunit